MSIDKSTRQHYAMQGKVKNYLGKQKMVKAPKYWLSKPDHVKAKLAYITDEEEKILIDKNLYGSLRGRPNIGPAGLPSLQGGDSGGLGGGGGKGGGGEGGWNPGVAAEERAKSKAASDRARANAREMAIQTAAKSTKSTKTGPSDKGDTKNPFEETGQTKKEQAKIASDVQELRDNWAFEDKKVKAPKTLTPRTKTIDQGVPHLEDPIEKTVPHYYGGIGSKTTYGFGPKGTQTYSEVVEDSMKRGFFDSGIGKFIKTVAPFAIPALLPTKLVAPYKMAKLGYDVKQNKGLVGQAINQALTSNLASNIRSNISTSNLTGKRSTTDTTDTREDRIAQRDERDGRQITPEAPKDVVTAGVEKFTQPQFTQPQLTELQKRRAILQWYADKGALNERGQSTLMQLNQMLEQALVSVAHGGFIDKPLMGRSRDI